MPRVCECLPSSAEGKMCDEAHGEFQTSLILYIALLVSRSPHTWVDPGRQHSAAQAYMRKLEATTRDEQTARGLWAKPVASLMSKGVGDTATWYKPKGSFSSV